ncbi:MAG TPA: glycosyltransferase family 39 protein [Oligoflexia bacterium]|nr:glycosyltransferase family 39 protein [Oligoflexia bacterium]HMP49182.1 glycosyltransferase family 39 protein [Oligoflexia bacterium]
MSDAKNVLKKRNYLINRGLLFLTFLCVSFSFYHIFQSIRLSSITFDEPNHYGWANQVASEGNFAREFSGYRTTLPITLINYYSGKFGKYICSKITKCEFNRDGLTWQRSGTLFFYFLLLVGSYKLGNAFFNKETGLLTVSMVALDPSIIAHSSLITVDIAFSAGVIWLMYSLNQIMTYPKLTSYLRLGFVLGLTALSKYTVVLFLPIICILIFVQLINKFNLLIRVNLSKFLFEFIRLTFYIFVSCSVTILVICAGFQFNLIKIFLSEFQFQSELMLRLSSLFGNLPLPLPYYFIEGLDDSLKVERNDWNVVINNAWYTNGTWKYFLTLFIYKTPTASLVFILSSFFLVHRSDLSHKNILIIVQMLICLIYFSAYFKMQVGYRYILFVVPLLLCFVSSIILKRIGPRFVIVILSFLLISSYLEFRSFTGYMLSYVNSVFVPKNKAYLYLADSNFDWAHTSALFYSHKPETFYLNPKYPQKGANIYSAMILSGVLYNFSQAHWVRNYLEPAEVIAHTYFRFDIDDAVFESYMNDVRTFKPNDKNENYCKHMGKYLSLNKEYTNILFGYNQEERRCIDVSQNNSDLSVSIKKFFESRQYYTPYIGVVNQFGICEQAELTENENIYFRLTPGQHVICYNIPKDLAIVVKGQ